MSQTTRTSVAAELTRWAIERSDYLMREKSHMKIILKTFERDTGLKTTYYTVKQVFGTLDIPVGRMKRKTNESRLDRLINEVFILSERLQRLANQATGSVGAVISRCETTPGLKSLHDRHAPPDPDSDDAVQ